MQPWIRKYAPVSDREVVGQPVERVRTSIADFRPGSKPVLLVGPPGVGKTSAVHAIARSLNYEVIELNASDTRNKASVTELLGAALGQQSLLFGGKIILIDEADGLSGTKDRGGLQAVLSKLSGARFPIVITANDASSKLKALVKASTVVEFAPLQPRAIVELLQRIVHAERLEVEERVLSAIAHRSRGDARAAINDLQTLSGGGRITVADLEALGDREQKEQLEHALVRIFKTTKADVALPALDNVDADLDQIFLWIDANMPKEYTRAADRARAFEALAEADRFFGRIRRWQYYRFYVYIYNLLTAGIAVAKDEKYPGAPKLKQSSRPLMIWMANNRNAKRKAIAAKLAEATHTSAREAYQQVPYIKAMFAKSDAIAIQLGLTDEEVAWLRNP